MIENTIYVTRSSMPPMEEYIDEIKDLWDSHWLTNMGEKHISLQEKLCEYLKVPYVELLTNGHMALELTLQAMELRGEVITTPFTFASTTHAIVRNGLVPVFCDINPVDFTIDVTKIEDLITENTCAIMPVHVYGNICNVEEIEKIAKKYNLKVIYDAAHTFGVKYKGKGIGSFGDASCFSFHATKVFNTIEGGAVSFHDNRLGKKLYQLKNFGIRDEEHVDGVGANAKMNEFQAAMGLCNLRHIEENIKLRKERVKRYQKHLEKIPGVTVWKEQKDIQSNYAYFPIIIDKEIFGINRDELSDVLQEHMINVRKYFYPITNSFDCFAEKYDVKETPVAYDISKKVLTIPLYPDLDIKDVDYICDVIKTAHKKYGE